MIIERTVVMATRFEAQAVSFLNLEANIEVAAAIGALDEMIMERDTVPLSPTTYRAPSVSSGITIRRKAAAIYVLLALNAAKISLLARKKPTTIIASGVLRDAILDITFLKT